MTACHASTPRLVGHALAAPQPPDSPSLCIPLLPMQPENPFNHPLPKYPIQAQPRHAPTFQEMGEVHRRPLAPPPPSVLSKFPSREGTTRCRTSYLYCCQTSRWQPLNPPSPPRVPCRRPPDTSHPFSRPSRMSGRAPPLGFHDVFPPYSSSGVPFCCSIMCWVLQPETLLPRAAPSVPIVLTPLPLPPTRACRYKETPVFATRTQDKAALRRKQVKGRQEATKALLSLNQRVNPGAPVNYKAADKARWGHIDLAGDAAEQSGDGSEVNPFLAPPVWEDQLRGRDLQPRKGAWGSAATSSYLQASGPSATTRSATSPFSRQLSPSPVRASGYYGLGLLGFTRASDSC